MSDIDTYCRKRLPGSRVGLAVAVLACLAACDGGNDIPDNVSGDSADAGRGMAGAVAPASATGQPADDRVFATLRDFVEGYWVRPIPTQGDPPDSWSDLEGSLRPEACAACHPVQHEDWQTTVHSGAYSPGLSGQLVNWEESAFGTVRSCLVCHAPLSEQSARLPGDEGWEPNPAYDEGLRNHGIVCASCHVRGNRRHGPPRRDGSVQASPEGSPHGGVERTEYFEDSRFCSGCHQFGPGGAAPNGKPLENTYAEWESSRYPAEGVTCQTCHMPDRKHLWRGIHDPEMVRAGVTIEWVTEGGGTGLRITNTGTGHRFPTYATPEVRVRVELLDANGRAIDGSTVDHSIARRIAFQGGGWIELSDTRLAPDSGVVVAVPLIPEARYARASISVQPDVFYMDVFNSMLAAMLSDTSRSLLSEAHRRTQASSFRIFEETAPVTR